MERDNAYAVRGGSLLPSDICTRLYGALQRKRAEKGKPVALTIPMIIERGEHLIGRDTSHKFRTRDYSPKGCFPCRYRW